VIGGRTLFLGVSGNCGSPSYTGPGDCSGCNTTPVMWGGLFAYSAAKRGSAAVNACNSTGGVDVGCGDLSTDATTGKLVAATIFGITCPGANCTVKILYDQSGNTNCGGSACDLSQSTVATRPTLDANCIGTLPCMNWGVSTGDVLANSTGFGAKSQPFTISIVYERDTFATFGNIFTDSTGNVGLLGKDANNQVLIYNSNLNTGVATAADGSFHGIQAIFDQAGAGSYISVNGSSTAVNLGGTSGWGTGLVALGANARGSGPMRVGEVGFWASAFTGISSGGQAAAENTNQQARWGF
jgi:hypothetical protein